MPEHTLAILALFELGGWADAPDQGITVVGARDDERDAAVVIDGRAVSLHAPVVAQRDVARALRAGVRAPGACGTSCIAEVKDLLVGRNVVAETLAVSVENSRVAVAMPAEVLVTEIETGKVPITRFKEGDMVGKEAGARSSMAQQVNENQLRRPPPQSIA